MTILSLAIQNTYQEIEIALLRDNTIVESTSADKTVASKQLIPLIDQLLTKHAVTIQDIRYIAVNQGPGPFTTLRVIIATVNGLSFASKIPLLGVDGMQALLDEHRKDEYPITIALLDAFNNDIYFAIQENSTIVASGYKNKDILCQELHQKYFGKNSMLLGNAATLYKTELQTALGNKVLFAENAQTCSLRAIGAIGYQYWQQQVNLCEQLFPLYLKHQLYKNQYGQLQTI